MWSRARVDDPSHTTRRLRRHRRTLLISLPVLVGLTGAPSLALADVTTATSSTTAQSPADANASQSGTAEAGQYTTLSESAGQLTPASVGLDLTSAGTSSLSPPTPLTADVNPSTSYASLASSGTETDPSGNPSVASSGVDSASVLNFVGTNASLFTATASPNGNNGNNGNNGDNGNKGGKGDDGDDKHGSSSGSVTQTPEPATLLAAFVGLASLGVARVVRGLRASRVRA